MNNPDREATTRPLGRVALVHDRDGTLWVEPPADNELEPFTRFKLPRIENIQMGWLLGLSQKYYTDTRRCMAVMLLLDVTTRQWSWCIPWQKCDAEAACWQPDRRDGLVIGPHDRLAGVFQSVAVADPSQLPGHVAPIAGVQIINHYLDPGRAIWSLVRLSNNCLIQMELDELVHDNISQVLDESAPRMQII